MPIPPRAVGPRLAAVLLAAVAVGPGCGVASRPMLAQIDLSDAYAEARPLPPSPEALARLRGADPELVVLWYHSIRQAQVQDPSGTDPQLAIELTERALRFHPGDPELTKLYIGLLDEAGRSEEALAVARRALASLPPAAVELQLRDALQAVAVRQNDLVEARRQAEIIGSLALQFPEAAARAWARLALAHAYLGDLEEADAAFKRSLDRGPAGVQTILVEGQVRPERGAASRFVRDRALERHPNHPDLVLGSAFDAFTDEELLLATEILDALAEPVPDRLDVDVFALRAQIDIARGDVDGTVERMIRRIEDNPAANVPVVALLIQVWATHGVPGDREMYGLLTRIRSDLRRSQIFPQVEAALQELQRRAKEGVRSALSEPPAPGPTPGPAPGSPFPTSPEPDDSADDGPADDDDDTPR